MLAIMHAIKSVGEIVNTTLLFLVGLDGLDGLDGFDVLGGGDDFGVFGDTMGGGNSSSQMLLVKVPFTASLIFKQGVVLLRRTILFATVMFFTSFTHMPASLFFINVLF